MIVQYKSKKGGNWRDFKNEEHLQKPVRNYKFRLVSNNKREIIAGPDEYEKIIKKAEKKR